MQKTLCTWLVVLQFLVSPVLSGQVFSEFNLSDSLFVTGADEWIVTGETAAQFRRSFFLREGRIARGAQPGSSAALPAAMMARVVPARNGQFFGVLTVAPADGVEARQSLTLTVFAASGTPVYAIEQSRHFDDPLPVVCISGRDGAAILGQNATATVTFFDGRGKLQRQVVLFPDAAYDLERVLTMDLSADGRTAAIAAAERAISPPGSDAPEKVPAFLFLFAPHGQEIRREPLPHSSPAAVAIAADGGSVAAASYGYDRASTLQTATSIFDRDGTAIARVPLLFRQADFAGPAGVALLAEKQLAVALRLSDGTVIWRREIPREEGMITAVQISETGNVAALLVANSIFEPGGFVYTHPVLKLIDDRGNLRQNLAIKYQNFRKPALQMSADGRHIFVGLADGYRIYQAAEN